MAVGRWSSAKLPQTNESDAATSVPEVKQSDLSSALGQLLAQTLKRPEIRIEHLVPMLYEIAPDFFIKGMGSNYGIGSTELRSAGQPRAAVPTFSRSGTDNRLPSALRNELKSVETEIKYEGYLQQQERAIERLKKAEQRTIPEWFDYKQVSGLSREMNEKLQRVRPQTLGQASRIPGVTPAAVSLINVYIEIQAKRFAQASSYESRT